MSKRKTHGGEAVGNPSVHEHDYTKDTGEAQALFGDLSVKGGKMSAFFGMGKEKAGNISAVVVFLCLIGYALFSIIGMDKQSLFFGDIAKMALVFLFGTFCGK